MVRCTVTGESDHETRRREALVKQRRAMDPPIPPVLEDILTGACVIVLSVMAVLLACFWVPCWIVGKTWNNFRKESQP